MGWVRRRVRQLERLSKGETISIPQVDGSTRRFPQSALQEAFLINKRRIGGEDVEPHPLTIAADNSSDPRWSESFVYASPRIVGPDGVEYDPTGLGPPEDLSEQALRGSSE